MLHVHVTACCPRRASLTMLLVYLSGRASLISLQSDCHGLALASTVSFRDLRHVRPKSPPQPSSFACASFSGRHAQEWAHKHSARHPRAQLPAPESVLQTPQRTHPGFLSHLTAGLPHVLSCFHPCGVPGAWSSTSYHAYCESSSSEVCRSPSSDAES